jgi:bifunctional non-homologous end joining protein LigD
MDYRNDMQIKVSRPKGGYRDEIPPAVFKHPNDYFMDVKEDGFRCTWQITGKNEQNLLFGRNREGQLKKGVGGAGKFFRKNVPYLDSMKIPELVGTMFDGEIVGNAGVPNSDGSTTVDQSLREQRGKFIGYVIFDILFWNGIDIRNKPLIERRILLQDAMRSVSHPHIKMVECHPAVSEKVYNLWVNGGEEGAVIKHKQSVYRSGAADRWHKWKAQVTEDAIIVDVVQGKDGGSPIQGIPARPNGKAVTFKVHQWKEDELVKVAHVGALPKDVQENGYMNFESYKGKIVEFTHNNWNGREFLQARFVRFRDDKDAKECVFQNGRE